MIVLAVMTTVPLQQILMQLAAVTLLLAGTTILSTAWSLLWQGNTVKLSKHHSNLLQCLCIHMQLKCDVSNVSTVLMRSQSRSNEFTFDATTLLRDDNNATAAGYR
jgi:hypothetical protein